MTRRKLLMFSAPVVLVLVVLIAKCVSVVIAGHTAQRAYADRDTAALRTAVGTLQILNVAESAKAPFAAGSLAVLDGRVDEAERRFTESLDRTAPADSCPVRVNLELVRETLGDRAATAFDTRSALIRYRAAQTVVQQAPPDCFAGNADPDPQRRTVRADALARLDRKINALEVASPPPPPPPVTAGAPPPPTSGGAATETPAPRRLHPDTGTPLDRLQQILRDAAAQDGG
jgi:hypothetical protein